MESTKPLDNAFGRFQIALQNELTTEHCHQLSIYFECTPARRNKIRQSESPGPDLLQFFAEKNIIKENNVIQLLKPLEKLELNTALQVVKDYHDSSVSAAMDHRPLPKNDFGCFQNALQRELTSVHCRELSIYFRCPAARRDKINRSESPGLELLEFFAEKRIIEEHNVKQLITALEDLELNTVLKMAKTYQASNEIIDNYPHDDEEEIDEEDDQTQRQEDLQFDELLELVGLRGKFPGRLSLQDLCIVRNPQSIETNLPELFWERLSALDYRVRTNKFVNTYIKSAPSQIGIRDFIFSLMHCSDSFLRQDIIEKMAACQLAVPIILRGAKYGKSIFLNWSLRRIIKKWKEINAPAVEHHIITVPVVSVAFLRIGDIKDFSKSLLLNHLVGLFQGHHNKFPYFLSNEDDFPNSEFSDGCVEGIWCLPTGSIDSNKFKCITSIFNLSGDSTRFTEASDFCCRSANLTIVFFAKKYRKEAVIRIKKIELLAKNCRFISIDDECKVFRQDKPIQSNGNWLFVRCFKMETICREIHKIISKLHAECTDEQLATLDSLDANCINIDVEDDNERFKQARTSIENVCTSESLQHLLDFKKLAFPLQEIGLNWVEIDKEHIQPDGERFDDLLQDQRSRKDSKRIEQLEFGLSQNMEMFMRMLRKSENDTELFGYFLSYLQERLRRAEDENISESMKTIKQFDKKIVNLDYLMKYNSQGNTQEKQRLREERHDQQSKRQIEVSLIRKKRIGWEHFIREFGQWFEANNELGINTDPNVSQLPDLAARLLINGHSLEIMNGDTARVSLSWVSKVLSELVTILRDPLILVVAAVGVQSSGKSTLLNAMFGVRFPVRSGQCTKGIFLRILKVDDNYVSELGLNYIFLIDSEGIRSQERMSTEDFRFDNELITLVMCISDITILNIAGENIGPEMTGLLQIAAHALIRMKKVELHSNYRIIQQQVSDLTDDERNRVTMTHIEDTLNRAIKEASKEEGFEDRYEQFSDVFNRRRGENGEENVEFVPSLWTGPMSSPNERYGQIVMNFKNSILEDVRTKKTIIPQFNVSAFRRRIIDVWTSVKTEKFLFNFQDSTKAIDFDHLCLELNKWIKGMELDLMQALSKWQSRISNSSGNHHSNTIMNEITLELQEELNSKKTDISGLFQTYVSNHPRMDSMAKHSTWFDQQLKEVIRDEKNHVLTVLKNTIMTQELHNDFQASIVRLRKDLRQDAKRAAENIRTKYNSKQTIQEEELNKEFDTHWKNWLKDGQRKCLQLSLSEETLEATCEKLLLTITTNMAVSPALTTLMDEEGGIKQHSKDGKWINYFPKKNGVVHIKEWFLKNEETLQRIIEESENELTERINSKKKFDVNIMHFVIRDALQNLGSSRFISEPPNNLKAKVLLHIVGKLFTIALEKQRLYEAENSFKNLTEKEREPLRQDFIAFIKCESVVFRAIDFFRQFVQDMGDVAVQQEIENNLIHAFLDIAIDSGSHNKLVLNMLCRSKVTYLEYVSYTKHYFNSIAVVLLKIILECFCQQHDTQLKLHNQAKDGLTKIADILLESATYAENQLQIQDTHGTENVEQSSFKQWFQDFIARLITKGFHVNPQFINHAQEYDINDVTYFVQEFKKIVTLSNSVMVLSRVPNTPDELQIQQFLTTTGILRNVINIVTRNICFEQCPFCRAPCANSLPMGPNHGDHFALTHLPLGISGNINPRNSRLDINDCQSLICSTIATYTLNGRKKFYKKYRDDFPSWLIEPRGEEIPEHSSYWRWVMNNYNMKLAEHYHCSPAKIPSNWKKITQDDALQCVSLKTTTLLI